MKKALEKQKSVASAASSQKSKKGDAAAPIVKSRSVQRSQASMKEKPKKAPASKLASQTGKQKISMANKKSTDSMPNQALSRKGSKATVQPIKRVPSSDNKFKAKLPIINVKLKKNTSICSDRKTQSHSLSRLKSSNDAPQSNPRSLTDKSGSAASLKRVKSQVS